MLRRLAPFVLLVALAGCPSSPRETPPPLQAPAAVKEPGPACGTVFRDPLVHGRPTCCVGPSAGVLKKSDLLATCGRGEAEYAGEVRDGDECRYHFKVGGDPKEAFVAVNRPIIPPGVPAPTMPDPLLPWTWKKTALRDALGFVVTVAPKHPEMLQRQFTLWAARGRRIVGMKVAKSVCTEAQAIALLQKAIDSGP